ncbi:MAG: hypothetical protein DCC53_17055 [Chloroflexi bacterium]|nr:MAG: hypothetical protein DCC53_17055 [Chloroflexota bacterium]
MSTNLTGQTLGKYELRALLGEGGMGAVYRAYDHTLKREVALKVVNLAKNAPDLRARFIREAETAAGLEHSHIVRVYDYGVEPDINYIVMQNLTGGTLAERMKQAAESGRSRASLPEIALLLEQLAGALDYAHAQGVIHRDIKPQNVMFNNQGQAFLVDFGIAKLLTGATNMTGSGMAMGTPSYMSPEQWASREIGPAADQYALAVMTYQLIAGRLPFEAETPLQVMYKHMNDQPTPISTFRPDVPADLMLVMDRAMAKDPAERFPNCTQFAQAFASAVVSVPEGKTEFFTFKLARPALSGAPYTPTPSQQASTPLRPASSASLPAIPLTAQPASGRSRSLLIGGIGALVVIGGLAVLLLGGRGPSEAELRLTDVGQTLVAAGLATGSAETREAGLELIVTDTAQPVDTAMPTGTPSATATRTATPTPTYTASSTATSTNTATLTPTYTSTLTPTYTSTNTATVTPTYTATHTETATLDVRQAAVATRDGFLTATATLWTPTQTPTETWTPDIPATIAAEVTALYYEDQTATATLWTPTPTPTATATFTMTPSPTATHTLTPTPTPDLLALAHTPVARNANWSPIQADFDGVTMMLVPAGCFQMGDTQYGDEQPIHRQCFDAPFWIDKTEVTQAQFRAKGGVKATTNRFNGDNRPVESITWFEARDYCEQRGARLPTEAEWEYAARGPDGLEYPWGDTFIAGNTVDGENSGNQTANVGSRPAGASWVGALDMSGSVREWTSSLYESYPYAAADGREADTGSRTDVARVLRGGSWDLINSDYLRAPFRSRNTPGVRSFSIGMRCARSLE